jgi:tripartite-type tricarboxylate transporter receptor subunit TctC
VRNRLAEAGLLCVLGVVVYGVHVAGHAGEQQEMRVGERLRRALEYFTFADAPFTGAGCVCHEMTIIAGELDSSSVCYRQESCTDEGVVVRTVPIKTSLAALVLLAVCTQAAGQKEYPSRPMRFIVGNAPGGSTSFVARLVADEMTKSWGHQVVVDNRAGGDGVIAAQTLQRSAPDGHTMLLVTAAFTIRPALHSNKVYDAYVKEFVPVTTLVSTNYILVLNPSVPANTVKEVIALAKANPGYLKGAVSNRGGSNHLALELFNVVAGTTIKAVPYKGGGPGMIALLSGEVNLAFNNAITVLPHVKSGKLKAIGVGGTERLSSLPQVPTFAESGVPGYSARNWFGVVVPARTPDAIVVKLAGEIARIRSLRDFREKIEAQGVEPFALGPKEFRSFIRDELALWAKVVKQANVTMGQGT